MPSNGPHSPQQFQSSTFPPSGGKQTECNRQRGSARRTGFQLERKRMQDRESQRNVRERTKKYIASLEEKLAELGSPTCIADLEKKNEELRKKVDTLESTLQAIIQIATKESITETVVDKTKKGCRVPPADHAERPITHVASPSSTQPPCLQTQAVLETKAPEEIAPVQQQGCMIQCANELANGEGLDEPNEIHAVPGGVGSGGIEEIIMDFNKDFTQPCEAAPLRQISTSMPSMHATTLQSLAGPSCMGPTPTMDSLNGNSAQTIPDQLIFDKVQCLNTLDVSPGLLGPERRFPTPENCTASNIWDSKLIKCISEHQGHLGEFVTSMPDEPELRILLDPKASHETTDSLTRFLSAPITQWNFKLPERLAIFWLNFILLKYRIFPTQDTFNELPTWLRPCPLQCQVGHPIYIDALPWPNLRDKLTFEHRLYPFHQLTPVFCSSLNVNWPYNHAMTYVREASGTLRLSRPFKTHLRKLENWSLKPAFAESYPELTWAVTIK